MHGDRCARWSCGVRGVEFVWRGKTWKKMEGEWRGTVCLYLVFGVSGQLKAQWRLSALNGQKCPDTGRPHLKSRHGDRTASPRSCHAGTLRATLTPRTPQVPGNGDLGSASCDVSRPRTNSVHDTHPIHDGRQIATRPPIEAGPPPLRSRLTSWPGRGDILPREVDAAYKAFVSPQRVRPQAREILGFCISSFCISSFSFSIPRLEERLDEVSEC